MPPAVNTPQSSRYRKERRREIHLQRNVLLDDATDGAVTYKIATEQEELESSFELVWESYVKVGLQAPNTDPIRFTKYHLLPTTKVFVAKCRPELMKQRPNFERRKGASEIIGTLTLVVDSPMGLPMEELCGDDVQRLRRQGSKPAEAIALAINPAFRNYNIMMYLYKLMFAYAKQINVTDITCAVIKRHVPFYQSVLLFEPMGDLRAYSAANGLETQGHRFDIARGRIAIKQTYHQDSHSASDLYTFFFANNQPLCSSALMKEGIWNESVLRYFLTVRTRFIEKLDQESLSKLRLIYREAGVSFPF